MEMEHFIETVRKYPCLWNTAAIEYRDQELKDAAWAEVMKETDLSSVKEVKLKWKKLRDSYRDALKRQNDMLAKDPSNSTKKNYPWKYMGLMQFLQPHMSVRKKPAESPHYASPADQQQAGPGGPGGSGGSQAHFHHSQTSQHAHNGDPRSSDDSDSEPESSPKRKGSERLTLMDRKLDYLCKAESKRRYTEAQYRERKRDHPPAAPDPLDIFFNSMCQSTKRFPYPAQIKIKKTLFGAVIEAEEALLAEQQNYASLWARGAGTSSSSEADDNDGPDGPEGPEGPDDDDQDRKPS
ncbi:unnamed protein product [Danaus chrysippus]|uniref:(African queen) hypothetical protein n=1 Tax=Danaus chrysippus TaxID=151541 RepID=A0A8J2VTP8_9NEOP|nr:unnamed protein product [Danaus chrysippus]